MGAYAPKGCVFTLSSSSGMRFGVRWAVLAPLAAEDPWIPEGIPEWRRGSELNRRIQLLQSRALPLGYPAFPKKVPLIPPRASSVFDRAAPGPSQAFAVFPQLIRLEYAFGRNDAGD